MKALGDWAFTAGINRIVFHRYQNQAGLSMKPGMTMGPYGVHWERTQTWWDLVPAYHTYLARCQFMLRRGLPVADVCFLVAEGAPHVFRPPASALRGDPPGPSGPAFDGCPPETLLAAASVKDGRIVLPDGMSYRVLVIPERETMTPALVRKVRDLVAAGATVIGPRPRKSPSLAGFPGCDAEVEAIAGEVWGDCDGVKVTEHSFGLGRVIWVRSDGVAGPLKQANPSSTGSPALVPAKSTSSGNTTWSVGAPPLDDPAQYGDFGVVISVLHNMSVAPDFSSEIPLRWTHRHDGATEIYFVANPEDRDIETDAIFRVSGKRPEVWDPVTGTIRKLTAFMEKDGPTSVRLKFDPHQSFFVIFRETALSVTASVSNPAAGAIDFPVPAEVATLDGPWDVSFDPKWGGPAKIVFDKLDDWSQRPEDGIRYYSGTASYTKTVDLPSGVAARSSQGDRLWLDLGTVKNIAAVRLNGRDIGVVWCDPWRVEITSAVKSKGNRLEIRVANLWPNRLIGDEREPPDAEYARGGNLARWPDWLLEGKPRPSPGRLTFSTWKHYNKDSPLLPSGLLGPVKILRGS
jgi:hypothetical protein